MKSLQDNLKKDYKWKKWIENTKKTRPYVDTETCMVFWGTDADAHKEKKG